MNLSSTLIWGYLFPGIITLAMCLVSWGLYKPINIPILGDHHIAAQEESLAFHWVLVGAMILAVLPVANWFGIYRAIQFLWVTGVEKHKQNPLKPAPVPYKVEPPTDPSRNWLQTRQHEADY